MPIANLTSSTIRYRLPSGKVKEWAQDGTPSTPETVNHENQGVCDVVDADVLPFAIPCGPDQYFVTPVLDEQGLMVATRDVDGYTIRVETSAEFWGRGRWRFDLVVTRHAPLVAYLIEEGWISKSTKVLDHVDIADVRGKHVLGVLPMRLAAECASITEVPMNIGPEERRLIAAGDFPVERMREVAGSPRRYVALEARGIGAATEHRVAAAIRDRLLSEVKEIGEVHGIKPEAEVVLSPLGTE